MTHTVTLTGPNSPEKRRIWRVLQLLQQPNEWDSPPPHVTLVWQDPDGKQTIIEAEG